MYATVTEIKAASPDAFGTGTSYDDLLRRLAMRASRLVDRLAKRGKTSFVEVTATKYLDGHGKADMWMPDCLSLTSVSISSNDGSTYTALDSDDYDALGGVDRLEYAEVPSCCLRLSVNGGYSNWYAGQKTAKVVGLWGWHDDYDNAWEDSQDTVQDDPLSDSATSLTVSDADGTDMWGLTNRFQVGQLLKLGSEQVLVTARNTTTNVLTIVRAQNGTTAAEHASAAVIYIWRPPEIVKQAVIAQAMRWYKRGQQAWADTGGSVELGQLIYTKPLDPDIVTMLYTTGIRRVSL